MANLDTSRKRQSSFVVQAALGLATCLMGLPSVAQAQSTNNTFFWRGTTSDLWNTVANWNLGSGNTTATVLPQNHTTAANRKVLFTDEAGFITTQKSITLGSNVTLHTTADAFTIRNGEFTFDLKGFNLTAGGLTFGNSTGGTGSAVFQNSTGTTSTVALNHLTLWTNGTTGNTFNLGTVFGDNVNATFGTTGILQIASSAASGNPPGGTYTVDMAGDDMSFATVRLGQNAGTDALKVSFTNSLAGTDSSTLSFNNLQLSNLSTYGTNHRLFGDGITVNTTGNGSLTLGTTGGNTVSVDLAGTTMSFYTIDFTDTTGGKVTFTNTTGSPSTLNFKALSFANASGYGSLLDFNTLFGANVNAVQNGEGTFAITSNNGNNMAVDVRGRSLDFSDITFGISGGQVGKITFVNGDATASVIKFTNLEFLNTGSYGSTLSFDELFGTNVTGQQEGSSSFTIRGNGGINQVVDLAGVAMDFASLTLGTSDGNGIGKVTFTNTAGGAPLAVKLSSLTLLSTEGYGATFSIGSLFTGNIALEHASGGSLLIHSNGGVMQDFDQLGTDHNYGFLTLGSGAGNSVKLRFTNSDSANQADVTFTGLTLGASTSAGNLFDSSTFGPNVTVSFTGAGAVTIGSSNGGINNSLVVGTGQNYKFTTLSIINSSNSSASNNTIIVDGGTLVLNGNVNIQGGYKTDQNRSNNKLHVKNGGQVDQGISGTPSTFTTAVGVGSSLIVEGEGSLYKAWSTGAVTAANGAEILALDGGGIDVAGPTTISTGGLLRVTGSGSYYTSKGTFTLATGATLDVLDGGVLTVSKTGSNAFEVIGKVHVDNGSLIDVAGGARINHASGIDLLNGSSMTVKEKLTIGNSAKTTQTISQGSVLASTDLSLDSFSMANASEVIVTGAGSELYITGSWVLAGDGAGGVINAAQGKVTILDEGKFSLGSFGVASSTYTLPVVGEVYFVGNGFTQGANDAGKSYTANIGSGTTVVLKQGTAYNWGRGTLRVLTGGVLAGSSSSIFAEGGVNLIGGEINPGDGTEIGKLAMGSLNLGATNSKLSFDITGDQEGEYDQIVANTFLTNNHAYTVALRVAEGFSASDQMVFQLMNIAVANASTSMVTWDLSGATLTGSLDWDVSQFKETGVVSIYDTAATGNDSRLFLGAVEPTGGQTTTLPNARVLVGSNSYVEFDLNNSGTDGTTYSVSASGSITSPDATSGTAWVDGAKIRVGFDTSSTGAKGSGTLTIDNLAGSYNGGNPNSGSRDQNDTITVGDVSVVGNRDISAQNTADLGKAFVDTDTQDATVSLSGGSQDDNNGTRVILSGSGTTATSNGITAASTSLFNSVFNGANQLRDILLHGNFATSGSKSGTMNVAGLLADGESASLGATVDSSVQVNYAAQVYQRASIVVGVPHEGPLDAGETLQLGNLDTTDGGQRAAGEIVSRELSGDGWTFTGLNLGTVLGQNTAASGTVGFDKGMLLNGTVRTGALVLGLQHADQSIRGASAGDLGTVTVNLKHTVSGQTAAYGVQYSTDLTLGQSFTGLGLTSSSSLGTTATLLGGTTSHATTLLTMSFDQAPGAGATFLSDILELSGTGTDTFVLSLTYDSLLLDDLQEASPGAIPVLGWLGENDEWTNAVLGNAGMPDDWETLFSTYYREGAYQSGYDLGTFGWDASTNTVWAVLNHNSEFGVIGAGAVPEPGRALLLVAGLAAAFFRRRRNPCPRP